MVFFYVCCLLFVGCVVHEVTVGKYMLCLTTAFMLVIFIRF